MQVDGNGEHAPEEEIDDLSPSRYGYVAADFGDQSDEEDAQDAQPEVDGLNYGAAFAAPVMATPVASGSDRIEADSDRVTAYLAITRNRGMNGPPMLEACRPLTQREIVWFQAFVWLKTRTKVILITDLLRWLRDSPLCHSYGPTEYRKSIARAEQKLVSTP